MLIACNATASAIDGMKVTCFSIPPRVSVCRSGVWLLARAERVDNLHTMQLCLLESLTSTMASSNSAWGSVVEVVERNWYALREVDGRHEAVAERSVR